MCRILPDNLEEVLSGKRGALLGRNHRRAEGTRNLRILRRTA
ncbi:hypothetical protein DOT_0461 [Desulfosporosinus sp. OT]|nr:hypothetical protein DOT_0461 [Desulfosporosinus sp. OT]